MRLRHHRDEGAPGLGENMDRLRTEFISTVSHELRTPVTALHGAALTLRKHHEIDEQIRDQLVDLIELQSARLCDLVEELLIAATLRARAATTSVGELADFVAVVAAEAARALDYALPGVRLAVDVRVPRAPVGGSAQDLRRIVAPVIAHALAHSSDTADVHLLLTTTRRSALLDVTGWGRCTPQDDLDRLFEPFARLVGADSADANGLGLGLFIAREMARGLGGNVTTRWSSRDGCHFSVELPLVVHH